MEIKIRQKPQRSTGKTSLVLEYYLSLIHI